MDGVDLGSWHVEQQGMPKYEKIAALVDMFTVALLHAASASLLHLKQLRACDLSSTAMLEALPAARATLTKLVLTHPDVLFEGSSAFVMLSFNSQGAAGAIGCLTALRDLTIHQQSIHGQKVGVFSCGERKSVSTNPDHRTNLVCVLLSLICA